MEEIPEKKIDKKEIAIAIIFISLGMIIGCTLLVIHEVKTAKAYCEAKEYEFEFKFSGNFYYCDGEPFFKYDNGWDFQRDIKNFIIK